ADIMRILAEHGADPYRSMKDGTTPLMAAVGILEGNGRTTDRHGVRLIDGAKLVEETKVAEAVKIALSSPNNIDAVERNGNTAMHAAASLGYDSIVQLLADKGANLNIKNKRGLTPLGTLLTRKPPAAAEDADTTSGAPAATQRPQNAQAAAAAA